MDITSKIFNFLAGRKYQTATEPELLGLFFSHIPHFKPFHHTLLKNILEPDGRFDFDSEKKLWHAHADILSLNLTEGNYCAIDIETTGFNIRFDRITEIAAIKIRNGTIAEHIQFLVNPNRSIPAKIQELTGIDNEMLIGKPSFEQVAPLFCEFIGSDILIAHHSDFDTRFINSELNRCEKEPLTNLALCTCKISKKLLPGLGRYSLDVVADNMQVSFESRHRAYGDALVTAQLFIKYFSYFQKHSITTVRDLFSFIHQAH